MALLAVEEIEPGDENYDYAEPIDDPIDTFIMGTVTMGLANKGWEVIQMTKNGQATEMVVLKVESRCYRLCLTPIPRP